MATAWALDTPIYGDRVMHLARRIEVATEGRYRIAPTHMDRGGLDAVARGRAVLYHGTEHLHLGVEPGLAYFAGIPGPSGLDANAFQAWLTAGGGQLLWDDLAAGLGVKPLMAGHTGGGQALWLRHPVDGPDGLSGLRLHVLGLAPDALRRLGGEPLTLQPGEIAAALADGRLDGAEWAGPMASMALGLHHGAKYVTRFAFNPQGSALSLGVRRTLWETFSTSDRAVFEACAAEETRLWLADALAHRRIAWRTLVERHGVVPLPAGGQQAATLARAAEEAVTTLAGSSPRAQRIDASYRAFRALIRSPRRMPAADHVV
jgi:TRAP-type mannitol/chloroaromatic compound transport system substrate-binding protein